MSRKQLTGTRIRERRLDQGVRQADLARTVGISPAYLNLIEHNRRRIGGKLLVDLARQLGIEASALTEGAETALLGALRDAAQDHKMAGKELDRTEDFADRFPGWAQLVADLRGQVQGLERTVEILSDRLARDPNLSASLHEVLSAATAIRSTAAILADTDDIGADWQARFHRNLREDSSRLAEGAEALVRYLEESADDTSHQTQPMEEAEAYFRTRDWHIAALETPSEPAEQVIEHLVETAEEVHSVAGRDLLRRELVQYSRDAARLPLEPLLAAMSEHGTDPAELAVRFGCSPARVMRRLALLPEQHMPGPVGLVVCDGAGTLIFRKPVAGFELPPFGGACPIWPLFQALARPMAPIRTVVELPGRPAHSFLTYAISQPQARPRFDRPEIFQATMLILPPPPGADLKQARRIGSHCRICPRGECDARRELSILSDGF